MSASTPYIAFWPVSYIGLLTEGSCPEPLFGDRRMQPAIVNFALGGALKVFYTPNRRDGDGRIFSGSTGYVYAFFLSKSVLYL